MVRRGQSQGTDRRCVISDSKLEKVSDDLLNMGCLLGVLKDRFRTDDTADLAGTFELLEGMAFDAYEAVSDSLGQGNVVNLES